MEKGIKLDPSNGKGLICHCYPPRRFKMKMERNKHGQPCNHSNRKSLYFGIVLCIIQTICVAETTTPFVDEDVVRYVREQGMPNNIVNNFTALGFFSPSASPLTRQSTLDEINTFTLNAEAIFSLLVNSSNIRTYADTLLKVVNEIKS